MSKQAPVPPWRRDFPLLSVRVHGQPLAYLDNAATTQKPWQVIDALSRYYKTGNANVHRGSHALSNQATEAFEKARRQVAGWLGIAEPETLIWTRGATEAINLVAQSWGPMNLSSGDRILLMQSAHHANIVPWQLLADRTGAELEVVRLLPDGNLDLEHFRQCLTRQPKLVTLTHISNALGTCYPVAKLARESREAGATVLIDGAQALPHQDVNLEELACDFYVFSGHKVFGPTGIGALWGRRELLEAMPPWQAGGEMIERVSFSGTTFADLPFKFEAGTPNISGVIGLGTAIEYVQKSDRQAQAAHEQSLLTHALACCETVPGFSPLPAGSERTSLFSFLLDGHHPQDVAHWLDRQGIAVRAGHHCAMPLMESLGIQGTLRASFAFYNTHEEAERLARALDELVHQDRTQIETKHADTGQILDTQAVFAAKSWDQRYRALMQLAQSLPAMPTELKQERYRIPGCESNVWLVPELDADGHLACQADADARILKALVALLLNEVNGRTPAEVDRIDLEAILAPLDLKRHLSPSRGNGLLAIVRHIEAFAQSQR
ncbi:SufS family cysteine desulfurase [Marinobacterium sp. AK62]|uniref:cysteine desulfurase n=1 Tax=Marinobacterium alkalitolerans TaxID=1542925 RepID=A0ABS3Z8M9_9GAMM|nr:SufS family cysteine desulfurase [Marinobacterium alkalitolerans]MBP0048066.1 SufS family cysteine desulfurase [Marinobacterium alkalitolerans]